MLLETSIYNYNNFEETKFIKELTVELKSTTKKSKKNTSSVVPDLNKKIETFIHKNFSKEHYSECSVKKVTKSNENYYVEIDDNFCMNVDRNHTSSNIYFEIKPTGISQRCYCKKETIEGRLHGMCKEYASKEVALTKTLKKELFGSTTVSKKNKSIVTFNITRSYSKENCLNNCKNILWQLKHDLL
jgi:hypothetical protein